MMSDAPQNVPPPAASSQPSVAAGSAISPGEPPSAEVLKAALKAFRKRLKITQLDNESRIGRSPLSGSGRSTIDAITPPDQYPRAVWDALVKQGRLRAASHGMYSLVSGS